MTAAGVLAPEQLSEANLELKNIIWVVEQTSRQMGWQQSANASEWHSLVEQAGSSSTDLPADYEGDGPSVVCVGGTTSGSPSIVEFTQKARLLPSIEEVPIANELLEHRCSRSGTDQRPASHPAPLG